MTNEHRIAAVVINSVSHDARVLKEADSLAAAGYEVAVFGIQDNRCDDAVTERASGVTIRRCDWKAPAHHAVAWGFLAAGGLCVAVVAAVYVLLFERLYAIINPRNIAFLVGIGFVVVLVGVPFLLQFQRNRGIADRLDRLAGRGPAVSRAASRHPRVPLLDSVIAKLKTVTFRLVRERILLRMLTDFGPAVVHCHDLTALPIGCAWARRSGGKVVYDSHEIYEELSLTTRTHKLASRIRQRRYSRHVDGFVTINDSIAELLRRRYPSLPPAVIVKNATLPLARVEPYDGRLHEAAGLDAGCRILLYQGGFARFRGLDVLVEAGALLPDDWCLVMMGWGAYETTLRGIAGSDGRVRFIPPAPHAELVRWTSGGALGVIPYENVCLNHWFCSPNKLWEYPNAGVPILASPFPELRKPIEEHGIGRLLDDAATPEGIARAVASVTDDELTAMRRSCRRYIERDNWSAYERRLVSLYGELLGPPASASAAGPAAPVVVEVVPPRSPAAAHVGD